MLRRRSCASHGLFCAPDILPPRSPSSLAPRCHQGIAIALSTLALDFANYDSKPCCGVGQPATVRTTLKYLVTIVPATLLFLSLVRLHAALCVCSVCGVVCVCVRACVVCVCACVFIHHIAPTTSLCICVSDGTVFHAKLQTWSKACEASEAAA